MTVNAPESSSSATTCYDNISGREVAKNTELIAPNGAKYQYDNNCTFNCNWDPANNNCQGPYESSSSSEVSSSSSVESSSSVATSSSSDLPAGVTMEGECYTSGAIDFNTSWVPTNAQQVIIKRSNGLCYQCNKSNECSAVWMWSGDGTVFTNYDVDNWALTQVACPASCGGESSSSTQEESSSSEVVPVSLGNCSGTETRTVNVGETANIDNFGANCVNDNNNTCSSCSISGNNQTFDCQVGQNNSFNFTPNSVGTYTFTYNVSGVNGSCEVTVQVNPRNIANCSSTHDETINQGNSINNFGANTDCNSCEIRDDKGNSYPCSCGAQNSITFNTAGTYNLSYSITSPETNGTCNKKVTVNRVEPPTFTANTTNITEGENVVLTLGNSYGFAGCNIQGQTLYAGNLMTVYPTQTTTYTCSGANPASITINVSPRLPTINGCPGSQTLVEGNGFNYQPNVSNAENTTCSINISDLLGNTVSGSNCNINNHTWLSFNTPGTYIVSFSLSRGDATCTTQVTVNEKQKPVFSASSTQINLGESVTLSVTTGEGFYGCQISGGYIQPNGSATVTPQATTTYTCSGANPESITITVNVPSSSSSVESSSGGTGGTPPQSGTTYENINTGSASFNEGSYTIEKCNGKSGSQSIQFSCSGSSCNSSNDLKALFGSSIGEPNCWGSCNSGQIDNVSFPMKLNIPSGVSFSITSGCW